MSISSMPSLTDAAVLGGSSAQGWLWEAVISTADTLASSALSCDATALSTFSSSRLMLMLMRCSLQQEIKHTASMSGHARVEGHVLYIWQLL